LADEDDLRASLPRFESTSEFLSFSEPALERIQASAPSNPSIQFQLGRFAEQLGFDELAATAYRRYLVLVPTTGSAQAQRIEEWIAPQEGRSEGRPGARLLAVVPPHLPQVSFWSRRLRDESVVRRELAQLQRTAIESRWKEVQGEKGDGDSLSSEQISLAQFLDELLTLSPLSATDEVRREIDATILHIADVFSSSLRGSPRHSSFQGGILGAGVEEFLSVRALKTRLAVVPGWNISDLRPEQGMLSQWASTERLAFDRKYRSLGFAVGPREGVSLITVATAAPLTPDILSRLKLYVSEDNVEWQELPQNHLSVELVMLGGQSIIVFQIREQRLARLWKIHFASKSQEEKILGRGEELLAVYGELR
ncbi:hypothetical protein MRY87_10995, partial [bacterium]|nr:hypothetical protein [bacterium]